MKKIIHGLILVYSLVLANFAFADASFIDWSKLKNPVYEKAGWSVKDATMIYREENKTFYIFFSAFFESNGVIRSHISGVKTKDFITFSEPLFVWSGNEQGWKGLAAPEVIRVKDQYILTYNSWGDKLMKCNQLFYATSPDLENWENMKPLARQLTKGKRVIDVAVAHHNGKFIMTWKKGRVIQKSRIAIADSIEGPWTYLGRPIPIWMENGQLINIDGKWNMVMTATKAHVPHIAPLLASGDKPEDWLKWGKPELMEIPVEEFNIHDRANAGHLKDWRKFDGYFYLLYAGTTESDSYIGRGDNRLGLARSKDGMNWEVP